jgi:hypothetical protein
MGCGSSSIIPESILPKNMEPTDTFKIVKINGEFRVIHLNSELGNVNKMLHRINMRQEQRHIPTIWENNAHISNNE